MKLKITIKPVEGNPYEVITSLPVTVAWERKYKRRTSQVQAEGLSTEELLFMAHEAAKRCGIAVPMTLDGFIEKVDDFSIEGFAENPTAADSTDVS